MEDIKAIGFRGLLELKLEKYPQDMVPFLVNSYNSGARLFCVDGVGGRQCAISKKDVYDVFMLPCGTGKDVVEASNKRINNPDICLLEKWRSVLGMGEIKATTLESLMMAMKDGGVEFKRYFVLFAFGTLLAPKGNNTIDIRLVKAVENANEIVELDWCEYVLKKLDKGVSACKDKGWKNVPGFILLLNIIYFHRLMWRSVKVPTDLPLIQHWSYDSVKNRVFEEKHLADNNGGRYGFGVWDPSPFPICNTVCISIPVTGPVAVNNSRTVSFVIPETIQTDAEIEGVAETVRYFVILSFPKCIFCKLVYIILYP